MILYLQTKQNQPLAKKIYIFYINFLKTFVFQQ